MRHPVTVLFYDRSRRTPAKEPGTFESLIKTLSGFAGTVTLFAALLSVFGFLLLRSNSNLLGLSNFLDHTVSDYLYAGAAFAGYTFYTAVEVFFRGAWIPLVAGGIFFAAKALAKRLWPRRPHTTKAARLVVLMSEELVLVCLILAVILVVYFMYESLPPTQARDLLFEFGDNGERLKRADPRLGEMKASYLKAVEYFILSCATLWAAYFISRLANSRPPLAGWGAGRASVAARVALTLLVITQLLLLPVTYGQTAYSNKFHKVFTKELVMDDSLKGRIPDSDNVWLIEENPDYFILYYRDDYRIRLVKKDELKSLPLAGRENIFNR